MLKPRTLVVLLLITALGLAACQPQSGYGPRETSPTPTATPEPTVPADPELDQSMKKMDDSLSTTSDQDFSETNLTELETSR